MLDKNDIFKKEDELREEIQGLSNENKKLFYSKIENNIKDPDTYAVLNWVFLSGLHHFYLKKWTRGIINLSVFILGILLLFSEYTYWGIGVLIAIFILELKELFQSQKIVLDYNNKMMEETLKCIKMEKEF